MLYYCLGFLLLFISFIVDRRDTVDAKRREVRFVEGVKLSMVSDKCHTCCACSRQNHYFLRLALNAFRGPPTTMANLNNKKKKTD